MVKSGKRKSMNSSGVWEVEPIAESPTQNSVKKTKLENSFKAEEDLQRFSPTKIEKSPKSEVKSQLQANGFSPKKAKFSPNLQQNKQKANGFSPSQGQQIQEQTQHSQSTPQTNTVGFKQNSTPKSSQKVDVPRSPKFQKSPMQNKEQESNGNQNPRQRRNNQDLQKIQKYQQENSKLRSWPSIDFLTLISRIEEKSKDILEMEYSKGLEMIDWAEISFGQHTPEDCKEVWELMFKRAWTYRDIVDAIRDNLLQIEIKAEKMQQINAESSNQDGGTQQKEAVTNKEDDEEDDDDDDDDEDEEDDDEDDEDDDDDDEAE